MLNKTNKVRLNYIDIAKGIGILLVVIGHTVKDDYSHAIIFSFHMPLFFILSGFFIKPQNLKDNFLKIWRSLLIPYLFACSISLMCTLVFTNKDLLDEIKTMILVGYKMGQRDIPFMPVIWFLPVLAIAKLITQKLLTYINGRFYIFVIAVISLLMTRYGIVIPFGISQAMTASLFLLIGKIIMEYNIVERLNSHYPPHVILFAFIVCMLYCDKLGIVFQWNKMPLGIFNILISSFICISIISLCKCLEKFSNTMIIKGIIWTGTYSLIILCVHYIDDSNVILDGWIRNYISQDASCVVWIAVGILRFTIADCISYFLIKVSFIRNVFNYKS